MLVNLIIWQGACYGWFYYFILFIFLLYILICKIVKSVFNIQWQKQHMKFLWLCYTNNIWCTNVMFLQPRKVTFYHFKYKYIFNNKIKY